ncbi:LuxR C-terminal-related transcriptional regulator [Hymenobacter convexus]|uniref:LuxR C-terminal-related transcriptional regulator n=1 Tax=Hymenobacter sp. CA1UV-4 TaxID=3063782 RepID=UPI00271252F6|nr:LuxR C-terminal-related transcriptional regulator [Hymenobacter sp. CA1UV-4]MDO7852478.1 LuxR C-terminal-related transcriptional regulator [Hymenobacter sp. CA1UV-4]
MSTTLETDTTAPPEALRLASCLLPSQFLVAFDLWEQRCCYASPQAETLLGYSSEQMSLALLYDAIHPDDLPLVTRASELAMEFMQLTGQPAAAARPPFPIGFSIDYRLRCRNGHYRRVLRHNFVLAHSETGHPLITGSLFTDITGHKTSSDVRFSLDHPDFAQWLRTRKGERERTGDELSIREQEILARMLAGETTAAIADSLFISYFTVKTHRRNILRKMKANGSRLAPLDADLAQLLA